MRRPRKVDQLARFDDALGPDWAAGAPERWLLELGDVVCPDSAAVKHYLDARCPEFFRIKAALERAVRKGLAGWRWDDYRLTQLLELARQSSST